MWDSNQAAAVEPPGFARLVRDIRETEMALGDKNRRFYGSELSVLAKLRNSSI